MGGLSFARIALCTAVVVACAIVGRASPSFAQSDRYAGSISPETPETVEVTAPHIARDTARLNTPLERVSMSGEVSSHNLDLRTNAGADEFRWRVRDAAQGVCLELARIYPYRQAQGTNCYKTATRDGLRHANAAINDARQPL